MRGGPKAPSSSSASLLLQEALDPAKNVGARRRSTGSVAPSNSHQEMGETTPPSSHPFLDPHNFAARALDLNLT
jgi:hypothetical protein